MENIGSQTKLFRTSIRKYIRAQWELVVLIFAEQASAAFSDMMSVLLISLFVFAFGLFAGVAVALLLGGWLHNTALGFAIVSIAFLIKGIFLWSIRARLFQYPVMNRIIKRLTPKNENNQD